MPYALVYPMFAMVILTVVVLLIMFQTRVKAARAGFGLTYFKTYSTGEPPEAVLKTQRHYANLFELPMLFYAGCLAAMMVGLNSATALSFAWLFVAARVVHAYIHIGSNKIFPRMRAFGVGLLAVLGLWISIVVHVCAAGAH